MSELGIMTNIGLVGIVLIGVVALAIIGLIIFLLMSKGED